MNSQAEQPNMGGPSSQGPSNDTSASNGVSPGMSIGEHTIDTAGGRILCLSDIRGKISKLNDLAERHGAKAIVHTGDFGFYDKDSVERISDRTLRHVVQYSSLIDQNTREKYYPLQANSKDTSKTPLSLGQLREALLNPSPEQIHDQHGQEFILSEFPKLLRGEIKLRVPVYTIWGACEDVFILEKIRLATDPISNSSQSSRIHKSEYAIPNLTVLSEGVTRLLNIGGVKLRLFGLGGSIVYHKLFDNGEGNATIAGGNGTMWTTALQIGELVDTAQRVFDLTETRLLITHGSIGREGLLAQLALAIKADFTLSSSLHFRYATSYNDFATQPNIETFRNKLVVASKAFNEVYESVKTQVENVIDEQQKKLLSKALGVANRVPPENAEEPAWKNTWHWNLTDAAYGNLVLDIRDGRIGTELRSTGFNFAYRLTASNKPPHQNVQQSSSHAQAGPSKKPAQIPFQQRAVSNTHANAPSQHRQPPAKQGYVGQQKPEQTEQAPPQQSQEAEKSQTSSQQPSQPAAPQPAENEDAPASNGSAPSRNAPTPGDFQKMASSFIQPHSKLANHTGPHAGASLGPRGGRGRGAANVRGFVNTNGHRKDSSAGTSTSSPAEPASANTSAKEGETKQEVSAGSSTPTAEASTPATSVPTGEANSGSPSTPDGTSGQGAPSRKPNFVQRGGGPSRGDSGDWRRKIESEAPKSQSEQGQSQASGNESPPTGSFRGGRGGRGRGGYDANRGNRGEGHRGGGRGGNFAPRGSFEGRGNFESRGRGGNRGGRGPYNTEKQGDATPKGDGSSTPQADKAAPSTPAAPATTGGGSA